MTIFHFIYNRKRNTLTPGEYFLGQLWIYPHSYPPMPMLTLSCTIYRI